MSMPGMNRDDDLRGSHLLVKHVFDYGEMKRMGKVGSTAHYRFMLLQGILDPRPRRLERLYAAGKP
ncbi:unnamed protein product [Sphenostylis stenocarpa]|uniref:Uncharacterized protein n=1 Tax=Sphenostylis stenocarpa TaxID=92480 RepID=A0AA86VTI9_9FABA|nr:unnamed protein product [Sphenostylis stenocarpa]